MVQIVFESADGERTRLEVLAQGSVMQAAIDNNIRGIDADCGGCLTCGTCHVVIDPSWNDRLPVQTDAEKEMLEYVPDPQPNTRLSCQIPVTDALNGLLVRIPRHQR